MIGLSNFASKSIEEVVEANPNTFFQMYWTGNRDVMIQRMDRARAAGAKGLIATLDWSFSMGRDWGSPEIPEKIDLKTMIRLRAAGDHEAAVDVGVRPGRAHPRPQGPQPGPARR